MAKNDNLTDFLTDIADAIRAKKGITSAINPQNFSYEIASIQSGGGSSSGGESSSSGVSKNDVNFYDYDGTLLHSYSASEIASMSQLPELPTREGLTCQGWNYTLDNIKSMVSDCGKCDVGATYITVDGSTRLYIRIAAKGRMTVPLYFSQTSANGVTIDWGDGSATQTLSGTGNVNTTHTYSNIGDYCITLKITSGTLGLGHNSSSYCVMGSTIVYSNMLQKVEIGSSVTSIGSHAFSSCYSLASVVIPSNMTSIETYAFLYCYSLASVIIPSSMTSIGNYTFQNCQTLASVVIPSSMTVIRSSAFRNCYSLASVIIPSGVTSIGRDVFNNCESLASVVIPSGMTRIEDSTFHSCYGMAYYDFSNHKSVPTLSNTNAFTNIPSDCKIVVPDDLYDTWIAATNWSTYSSKIVKASTFTF